MWDPNDKRNYDAHNNANLGQICNDNFSKTIMKYASNTSYKTYLEIGTWNGRGSTMAFSKGFEERNDDYIFYSLECNKDKHSDAVKLFNNKNMKLLNEVIWNEEPKDFYEIFPECLSSKMYKHWNEVDIVNMKKCNIFLERDDLPDVFDIILLDGGEFTTYFEFRLLKERCKILMLDDTNTAKCKKIVEEIKKDPTWLILECENVRNGYLVAERVNKFERLEFVSSRGILESCDTRSITPISSIKQVINYNKIIRSGVVYICGSAISHFIEKGFDNIREKIILVSGDCDEDMPNDVIDEQTFKQFIEDPRIIHWYCQNMTVIHPKITIIPIGLDYHTLSIRPMWGPITTANDQERILKSIISNSKPFWDRPVKCYANFHFSMNTKHGYDRIDALNNIDKDLVYYEPEKVMRIISWKKQTDFSFCICPHGGGLDCHRNWEALILGCIPIVKSSAIDNLYDDLPVLIVNSWKEITEQLLIDTIDQFKIKQFNYEKLKLNYWVNLIKRST